jgi:flagellar motility protein MotE (MotC chaperone)
MNVKSLLWIAAPLALSAGVIWLSAQDPKTTPAEGVRVGELAQKLQAREKALAQRETELRDLEQRLTTLRGTLDKDRADLETREKALKEASEKFAALRARPPIDPQLIRTYEAMEPVAGGKAMRELASRNKEVAVSLLAGMQPKKAARILDQLAGTDAKLAAALSEAVGLSKPKPAEGA